MSTYRFITSNILTGQILATDLPIVGQTATMQINQVGNFQGYLPLIATGDVQRNMMSTWVNAVTPWKSILWILQDNTPIWGGPIIGWPHQSITDGTLPIQASSIEAIFKYRQVDKQLSYNKVDIFAIFKSLLSYGLNKTPNALVSGTGNLAGDGGLIDNVNKSGQIGSITEQAGFQSIYDCWNDLVTSYGLEYTFRPTMSAAQSLFFNLALGLPQIGRPYSQTRMQMMIPSQGAVDYAWQWVPSNPINRMVVSGSGTALIRTPVSKTNVHGVSTVSRNYVATATAYSDLNAGFPLLEGNTSFFGTVTSQAQINNYAKNLLYATTVKKSLTPLFTIGGEGSPLIRHTQLGDEAYFIATSPLHPAQPNGGPGLTQLMRIVGWTLTFPNAQQSELTQYQLGDVLAGSI